MKWIGNTGTAALIGLSVLSYVIWRFNPVFALPKRKPKPVTAEEALPDEMQEDVDEEDVGVSPIPFFVKGEAQPAADPLTNNNKLKTTAT